MSSASEDIRAANHNLAKRWLDADDSAKDAQRRYQEAAVVCERTRLFKEQIACELEKCVGRNLPEQVFGFDDGVVVVTHNIQGIRFVPFRHP